MLRAVVPKVVTIETAKYDSVWAQEPGCPNLV
jgi:hypothetical protein